MRVKIAAAASLIFSLLFAGRLMAAPNMQDGMWEITTKTEMPGMPVAIPPMKFKQCLTKTDYVPQNKDKKGDCKMTDMKVDGNTVTWAVQCQSKEGASEAKGKITYTGNGFDGVMKMVMSNGKRGTQEITQYMSGQRIGDCSK